MSYVLCPAVTYPSTYRRYFLPPSQDICREGINSNVGRVEENAAVIRHCHRIRRPERGHGKRRWRPRRRRTWRWWRRRWGRTEWCTTTSGTYVTAVVSIFVVEARKGCLIVWGSRVMCHWGWTQESPWPDVAIKDSTLGSVIPVGHVLSINEETSQDGVSFHWHRLWKAVVGVLKSLVWCRKLYIRRWLSTTSSSISR